MLNGPALEITDGGGVSSADMAGLRDTDWLKSDDTRLTVISDEIYTLGSVGIAITNPGERLSVYRNNNSTGQLIHQIDGIISRNGIG